MRLEIVRGDITQQRVDAIVNAANSALRGGGGVDGAIHRAGGPSILEELRRIGSCETGRAVVTGAGALPCRFVIHAVGPQWRGGEHGEDKLLASAYADAMARAREVGARTVALASVSTGAYGFPVDRAAPIALRTVSEQGAGIDVARFVLFSTGHYEAFERARAALASTLHRS